jgi:hypothetical protein
MVELSIRFNAIRFNAIRFNAIRSQKKNHSPIADKELYHPKSRDQIRLKVGGP